MDRECEVCLIPISDDQDFCNSCFDKVHPKEPKPECDHIVGVEFGCEECQERNELTKLSEIANIETKENCTWFKHCPECGEKLNITK